MGTARGPRSATVDWENPPIKGECGRYCTGARV